MKALHLLVAIRAGASLAAVAQHLADASRTGNALIIVPTATEDETALAMVAQLRQRSGRVVAPQPDGELEGMPPADQLEDWGLQYLLAADTPRASSFAPHTEFLTGSDAFESVIELPSGATVHLGDVVRDAHAKSGLSVADWNLLDEEARDALLDAQIEAYEPASADASTIDEGSSEDPEATEPAADATTSDTSAPE